MCEMTRPRMPLGNEWFPSTGELAAFTGGVEAELDGGQKVGRKADPPETRPDSLEQRTLEAVPLQTTQTFFKMLVNPANFLVREIPVEIVVQPDQNLSTRHAPPAFHLSCLAAGPFTVQLTLLAGKRRRTEFGSMGDTAPLQPANGFDGHGH